MNPVGYITDAEGRRVFALVPVAQVNGGRRLRGVPAQPATEREQEALATLLLNPQTCLETTLPPNPIRGAREAAGLSQADLAFALRISQPMLSRQEQPFRRLRPATVQRALEAIRRIQENRNRPPVSLDGVIAAYGTRLAASAARKPRDPVERKLLREVSDPVALREDEGMVRPGGERRRPPRKGRP